VGAVGVLGIFAAVVGVVGVGGVGGGGPFPNVADHVADAVGGLGAEVVDGSGGFEAVFGIAASGVPVVTPGVDAAVGAAGGFFPLGFGGEADGAAGDAGGPVAEGEGFAPVETIDGVIGLVGGETAVLQRENGRPLDENAIGNWLDEIYAGDIAQDWQNQFTYTAREFEEVVVNTLRPFASADSEFQERFNKLFDGIDVLPTDLHNEYYDFIEAGETIAAKQLLVPISWGRFHALRNSAKISWDGDLKMYIVTVPYTSELGLNFS
jgi:hypothetical protein